MLEGIGDVAKLAGGMAGGGLAAYGMVIGFKWALGAAQRVLDRRNGRPDPPGGSAREIVWQCHFDKDCHNALLRMAEAAEKQDIREGERSRRMDESHERQEAALARLAERPCPKGRGL